jgi:extracellular elastinolytic metalloproteinase
MQVNEYRIYRNDEFLSSTIKTTYIDENLLVGNYEYYVVTHYEMGCVADSSNHVKAEVGLGIKENGTRNTEEVVLYPNPTTGELLVVSGRWLIESVEVFDIYGRRILLFPHPPVHSFTTTIDISQLLAGVYFIKIHTEKEVIVKKIVKQ